MIIKGMYESPAAHGQKRQVCLLSQPFITRTVRRFICLPRGALLVTVSVASWGCRTARRRYAGRRCHGAGIRPFAAVTLANRAGVAGAVGPRPGFTEMRNRNRRSCVMLLGRAPSACFEEQDCEPGVCGRPEIRDCSRTRRNGAWIIRRWDRRRKWGGWVQVKLQLSRVALGSAVTLSLVGGSLLAAPGAMAPCVAGVDTKGEPIVAPAAVMITGGTITNETVIDISANAGTSISDASGGNNNLATTGGGNDGGEGGTDIASSGNGGVATSSADGGAVSIQDINSGGNVGNAISVGDTVCAPFKPPAPAPEKPKDVPKA